LPSSYQQNSRLKIIQTDYQPLEIPLFLLKSKQKEAVMDPENSKRQITQSDLDQIKREYYRPCIVAALVCDRKVGLLQSKKYFGYEFLQGGIEFGEDPLEAMKREVMEETGFWFYSLCNFPPEKAEYLFEARMETKVKGNVRLTSGEEIHPKGKHYLVYAVKLRENSSVPQIDQNDVNFSGSTVKFLKCEWTDSSKATGLMSKDNNPIKRDISLQTINLLKKKGYID